MNNRHKTVRHPLRFEPAGAWEAELRELALRRQQALGMGGPEALAKLHAQGRLDARQRLACLLDEGSFHEMGCSAGKGHYAADGSFTRLDPSNSIIGTGRIQGRKVALHVDDYSIRAGSSEASVADKWIYIERLALQLRMPLVRLVDSAGGSVKLLMQLGGTKIPGSSSWPSSLPMRPANAVVLARTHAARSTTSTRSTTPGNWVPRCSDSAGTTRAIAAA